MTTRYSGYVVTLAKDIREDDADAVISALRMVRGVISVDPVVADVMPAAIATTRRDITWQEHLVNVIEQMRRLP